MNVILRKGICCLIFIFLPFTAQSQTAKDYVDGNLITFNTNGVWCWFQDERAVVDTAARKLIVGSVTSGGGIEAVIYDLAEKKVQSKTQIGRLSVDDHNAPGFLIRPDGKYLAMFADHYDKYNTHWSIYDGSKWSAEKKFDWNKIPGGTNYTIAYNNIYYLSAENKVYDFSRANDRSPNFLLSTDFGTTWAFGGQLTTDPSSTYNKGYYKYWGNGVDRIDFAFTEQHPRDFTTSIYHGYIKGGKSYSTEGKIADENIFDQKNLPTKSSFTKVFAHGEKVNGATMGRCWESDIQAYDDGTIAILFKARADNSETDHRNFYSRYDGTEWKTTYIGKAGTKMYAAEQDYTGLGALCPDDPNTIYISSPFNPGDDTKCAKREIWKGVTTDNGATWKWTAVTANSSKDNFRPIVPAWNRDNTAVLWFRGTYTAAQQFNASIVGVLYNHPVGTVQEKGLQNSCKPDFSITRTGAGDRRLTVQYTLPNHSFVTIKVFTAAGKSVATLVNREMAAGKHGMQWDMRQLPAGIYFCRLRSDGYSKIVPVSGMVD